MERPQVIAFPKADGNGVYTGAVLSVRGVDARSVVYVQAWAHAHDAPHAWFALDAHRSDVGIDGLLLDLSGPPLQCGASYQLEVFLHPPRGQPAVVTASVGPLGWQQATNAPRQACANQA